MNYMKQLSELFGINERDVLLFMTMALVGGFIMGVAGFMALTKMCISQA